MNPILAAILAISSALASMPGAHATEVVSVPPISDPGILRPPEPSRRIEAPDSAKVSFTSLHTRGRNWLQVQIDSIGACQKLVVDSVKVLDTLLPNDGTIDVFVGMLPRRDIRVWWSLFQDPQTTGCSRVTASRYMVELPPARKRVGTDSVITSWTPGEIEAVGPGTRVDREYPVGVDQAGDFLLIPCPMYECMRRLCSSNDTDSRAEFMGTLREQIAKGLPVVRIGKGQADERVEISLSDTARVGGLGPLTKWNAGNLAWKDDLSIRTVASWGAAGPKQWRAATGRVFYRWRNGVVCCEGCDTLCQTDSRTLGISSGGVELEVSNDSTFRCGWSTAYDPGMAQELSNDWLILPDSSEVREGRLTSTFFPRTCAGRLRAWKIVNDTIKGECAKVALSDLDAGVGVTNRGSRSNLRVSSLANGIRVTTDALPGQKTTARLRDPSGRILSSVETSTSEIILPVEAHGFMVLEVDLGGRTYRKSIAR
jgi:hypothetical protein